MLALTVCQPYASMIASGEKLCENRTWHPPKSLRSGTWIAIHAGSSRAWFPDGTPKSTMDGYPYSAVIAVARFDVTATRNAVQMFYGNPKYRDHAEGPVCLLFDQVKRLDHPIPCRGRQRLWTLPPDVAAQVRGAVPGGLPADDAD